MAENIHKKHFRKKTGDLIKKLSKLILLTFIGLPIIAHGQVKITVSDSDDNAPLAFAHVISKDTSFQDYANIDGIFELPKYIDEIYISCLGYTTKKINIKEISPSTEVFLEKSSVTIEALSITAKKIDIYKELDKVRLRLRIRDKTKYTTTKTSFETVYNHNSIEKGEVFSNDKFVVSSGIESTERLFSDYSFDPDNLFLTVDIDRLIKKINLSKKKGYLHLLNRGRIKKKNTLLSIVEDIDSSFIVSYTTSDQSGYVKFNKFDHRLEEYTVLDVNVDKSIYSSINSNVKVEIDTLIIRYKFENGFVENLSFYIVANSENIGKIKSSGFIEEVIYPNLRYTTNRELTSIQYDAFLSDFSRCKPSIKSRNIFFDRVVERKDLIKDDILSMALLQEYGYAPNIQLWNRDFRLTENDFKVFDENIDFSRSKNLRSDFHAFKVDWVLFEDDCDSNGGFGNVPSIWKNDNAIFISKTKYHALLLANLSFDIYEVFRQQLLNELKEQSPKGLSIELIETYHRRATEMVHSLNEESNYGNSIEGLMQYNDFVLAQLGIDNIKALVDVKNTRVLGEKYSEGDLLLIVGREKEAIEFYEDVLKSMPFDKELVKPIYKNIIIAYHLLKNEEKVCAYYQKWKDLSNVDELNLTNITSICN